MQGAVAARQGGVLHRCCLLRRQKRFGGQGDEERREYGCSGKRSVGTGNGRHVYSGSGEGFMGTPASLPTVGNKRFPEEWVRIYYHELQRINGVGGASLQSQAQRCSMMHVLHEVNGGGLVATAQ